VAKHNIAYHEKTLGQQFCDNSAKDIIKMLLDEMRDAHVELRLKTDIHTITRDGDEFVVTTSGGIIRGRNLVVATGGKSIPKMGATGLGYKIAEQFGHSLVATRPGLVPLTFGDDLKAQFASMAGIASDATVQTEKQAFEEAVLFTHRGLSGPAILQISSYWHESTPIIVGFGDESAIFSKLRDKRHENGRRAIHNVTSEIIPKALATYFCDALDVSGNIADLSDKRLADLAHAITHWSIVPTGTEGYRTAEVTIGGVDTNGLSSKTMESKCVDGLYFIGEVVDVTGWLGGYNFQWAWSSGWAAGTAIAQNSSHLKG
jgi:predicted Rossmann fold flavoprotein